VSEKLCVYCVHMFIEDSRGCGGTYTGPWGEKGPSCKKGHFDEYTSDVDDMNEYRTLILKAQTCPDYEQVKP
jgi:hypothetical protein